MLNKYSEPFRFKQFQVMQQQSAMKIGTDAILVAAWANHSPVKTILDIGSGTGVISLMMAQRFADAQISAIEIEEQAVIEARSNFSNSPFSNRLTLSHSSLQEFSANSFDLIISNPPFFHQSLKASEKKRSIARHSDNLSTLDLCKHSSRLLSDTGKIALIVPAADEVKLKELFSAFGLYPFRKCKVKPNQASSFNRILIEFCKDAPKCVEEELIIYSTERNYSSNYRKLTSDFLLNLDE